MNDELNKKLAEWAGFIEKGTGHVWPDGRYDKLPNFTKSLDACFKWLVPKLPGYVTVTVEKSSDRPTFYGRISAHYFHGPQWVGDSNECPALALCLAIEKLIDGRED